MVIGIPSQGRFNWLLVEPARNTIIGMAEHLHRCLVYVDLNMVRAGVVTHPSHWPFSGYNEIQDPKRKKALIDYEHLRMLLGLESYELVKAYYRE